MHASPAQDRRQNRPGKFDYYVLSLSWTPTFCQESGERGQNPNQECGTRPYGFVVHGFWPQYESGFPEFCQVPAPRLNRGIVSSMLDLMPAPPLIFREWDRHGTCSGLTPNAFFDTIRKARATVKIPEAYLDVARRLRVSPNEVADAFVKINPGLSPHTVDRSENLHVEGIGLSRLPRRRAARLPTAGDRDAGFARREGYVRHPGG